MNYSEYVSEEHLCFVPDLELTSLFFGVGVGGEGLDAVHYSRQHFYLSELRSKIHLKNFSEFCDSKP